jgi:hypothetical protein
MTPPKLTAVRGRREYRNPYGDICRSTPVNVAAAAAAAAVKT